jgi:YegS/Rv2252/BmrU family lipid kinase
VILNPVAGRGYGAKVEPGIRAALKEAGSEFDLVHTDAPLHAVELARQAVEDGFELVVAAGGDGTVHEVVNGLVAASGEGEAGTLGMIPVGSGSDYAYTMGVPMDWRQACQRLVEGQPRLSDVGRVVVDGQAPQYLDNSVNIGFGGVVTRESRKVKRLRGMALYLPVVTKTIFLYYKAPPVRIEYDENVMELPAVMITVANGVREGGGFYIAPEAKTDDGFFELCIAHEMSRLAMLATLPLFMQGKHTDHKMITMARASRVTISSPEDLIAHIDGEMLCTQGHRIEFEVLPRKLRVWC